MNDYFSKLNKASTSKVIDEMKQYAIEQKVPIMQDEGLLYLKQLVHLCQVTKILEIGTAIGYSAIQMARLNSQIHIDTIERDEALVTMANRFVKRS
ncbi:MAG: SAM-dependent methyltransferase, partial [Bacilli bacterium]